MPMPAMTLLMIGLLGGPEDYSRPLDAKHLDQATLDAEGYGQKQALKREDDGLRITLEAGVEETGWKTPQPLKIGGDFTISAELSIRTLPKPAQEDGAAIGLAIALQNINQPDVTLLRLKEPDGQDIYRPIDKGLTNPAQPQPRAPMMFPQPRGAQPPQPPRRTFPASGDVVRMELRREGTHVRLQVIDVVTGRPRYLGQVAIGAIDVAAVKLFASNRNGAGAVDVLLRDVSIRADRITGLGTSVRTVFEAVTYGEPTSIEDGFLIVGGQPKAAPQGANAPAPAPSATPTVAPAPAVLPVPVAPAPLDPAAAPAPAAPPPPLTLTGTLLGPSAVPAAMPTQPAAPAAVPAQPLGPKPPTAKIPLPKTKIPLDEVESIRFERTPAMTGRFVGQLNLDFTRPAPAAKKEEAPPEAGPKQAAGVADALAPPPGTAAAVAQVPKVEPSKNGIRDLNLSISGLRASAIRQVTVTCSTETGPTGWRLDTSGSRDWPLVIRRSGTEAWADLFLEPPPGDGFQKDFAVSVVYQDGPSANTSIKAGEHTDPNLAVAPNGPAIPRPDAWVYLAGQEKLFGKLEGIGEEALHLTTPWRDRLDVPLTRVVGVHLALLDRKESPESFARRIQARGSEDLLLAKTKDGEVIAIAGVLEGTEDDRLLFRYQGKTRKLPIDRVEGLVMAARPDPGQPDALVSTFSLPGGVVVSGRWKGLDAAVWKVETAWGQELNLPAPWVQGVRFRGGRMTYLSDLTPSQVEESPFFGRRLPWRRDVGLLGEPMRIDGRAYDRGVAVHSRCILTYDLNGRFATFEALLGFDDAARGKGRVDCRAFADGKEIYANPDLRADGPPVRLDLPVAGAEQLRLLVDFGRDQDTGDRVIWANARLYRRAQSGAPAASPASRRDLPPDTAHATDRR